MGAALDSFDVVVVDCQTRKVIRSFHHESRVTDFTFNIDCRWLIAATTDAVIRIWNLPLAQMIDCFRLASPCTTLALSPNGEFLATAHVDELGIYLWSNLTLYSIVELKPLPSYYEPKELKLPTIRKEDEIDEEDEEQQEQFEEIVLDNDEEMSEDVVFKSPDQISEELITLSTLPQSKWKNLINLDLIKKRNKPVEPVTKPKNAPFFIPVAAGLEPTLDVAVENEPKPEPTSKIISKLRPISQFGELLLKSGNESNFGEVISFLKQLGPSAVDVEIRSLSADTCGTDELLRAFMVTMLNALKTNRDFELINSYLGLFLKVHLDEISRNEELVDLCHQLSSVVENGWTRLQSEFNKTLCVINYLKSAVIE